MKKHLILIILPLIAFVEGWGQQQPMFTHYGFNTIQVNPAYAGSREVTSLTALHRSQWVGFDGAPTTQTFTINSPVFYNSLGVGLSVIHDKIGPVEFSGLYADIAYRLRLTEKMKLAFGIKGGGDLMQGRLDELIIIDQNDVSFSNINNQFIPNIGFGTYLNHHNWYLGLSAPKLLQHSFKTNSVNLEGEKRHYWFIAGAMLPLRYNIKFKPTTFVKMTSAAPVQLDLTGMFIFNDAFEIGIMGRSGDAVGVLLGYSFKEKLRIGYSFDWSFENTTSKYNSGSHEVMLRYDIFNNLPKGVYSPRYF